MEKIRAAILGPGNIGIDLMLKILKRSRNIELSLMAGIDPSSRGLSMAREFGIDTSLDGAEGVLAREDISLVFECTSASAHLANAPRFAKKGLTAIDLTPAAVGPYIVPAVNIDKAKGLPNVNMVTCGGQATVPVVYAASRVQKVLYAEIISTISSKSAGPGTRANIDEFTVTTKRALETVGGAEKAMTIIILNPAEPPILMRNTIYMNIEDPDEALLTSSLREMEAEIRKYVPGYRVLLGPLIEGNKVTVMIEVRGAGDYLPVYAGNLDIITCAALQVGEMISTGGKR